MSKSNQHAISKKHGLLRRYIRFRRKDDPAASSESVRLRFVEDLNLTKPKAITASGWRGTGFDEDAFTMIWDMAWNDELKLN